MPKSEFWKNIKNNHKENEPFFSLAPMEAVTDTVFRRVVDKATAPDLFYTEFVNSTSIIHEKAKFSAAHRLYVDKDEKTPIVQMWGKDPEHFRKSALELKKQGFQAIDLNMGCPDPTVVKNGGGSGLIKEFDNAAAIIQATKEAGLPVSVKTRLGFNTIDDYKEWVPHLLKQDIEVLTIHLRSRKEMSKVDAHYEVIDEIIKMRDEIAPNTLIQVNGDIKSREQGMELYRQHPGIDGIMIGRGVFENPFVFDENQDHSQEEMFDLFKMQLDLYDDYIENIGKKRFETLRRFFKIYVRNLPNAAQYRDQLMQTHTTQEARDIIKQVERDMAEMKDQEEAV
ncbi:MAG: tRNA-dihydrouridine synthase [Lactobacillaceae bacterium]|jgi:tRNA-dihydrouridine synthase|nr:tRNA-dihydrouridine synthase [Lactobacillaceae bacterium]